MSLLPPETIDVFRDTIDKIIDIYGFDVTLYIPEPATVQQAEGLDIYMEKPDVKDHMRPSIKTKVFIEWKPEMKRLRRLGIFTEDELPIIAWFKNLSLDQLTRNSYIRIPINYTKGEWGTDEFELVDCVVRNTYNAIVVQCWQISPRRK